MNMPFFSANVFYPRIIIYILLLGATTTFSRCKSTENEQNKSVPKELKAFFSPPPELINDDGRYSSDLISKATIENWSSTRRDILNKWHQSMGSWPEILKDPSVEYIDTLQRFSITQYKIKLEVAKGWTRNGYLLVPDLEGPLPAALVVYYEPETGVGLGRLDLRDFALQLAKRGFVTLSLGSDAGSNYYPDKDSAHLQPLSMLAYMAANAYHGLANLSMVDPERIGVVGHSYGGKWAMFASCLYEEFALGAWSDGGIVFDETRANVNYWEPWYLGYDPANERKPGIPTDENPRTGAYKQMIEDDMDLHELHALMAPRPFLVSGGAEDTPQRWASLTKTIELYEALGHKNKVAMHNRPTHAPNQESNKVIYAFFDHFLK